MNTKIIFSCLLLSLVLAGCAGSPDIADSLVASKYANVSANDALKAAQIKFENAKNSELAFYSPNSFKDAEEALKKAEKLADKGRKEKSQLKYIYLTEQYLENGARVRKEVEKRLERVLTLKDSLQQRDAKKSYKDEYRGAMEDVSELIEDLETITLSKKGKSNKSEKLDKSQGALVKKLQALEIKVVKYNTLDKSKKILAKAKRSKAKKVAPKTYKETNATLKTANEYIAKNVHDAVGVKKVGDEFRFAVNHLLQVTIAVNELTELKKKYYEDRILENEQRLLKIGEAIKHKDVRDKSINVQAELLAKAVAEINTSNDKKTHVIAEMGDIEKALLAENKSAQDVAATQSESFNQQMAELKMKLQNRDQDQLPLKQNITDLEKQVVALTIEKNRLAHLNNKSEKSLDNNGKKTKDTNKEKANTAVAEAKKVTPEVVEVVEVEEAVESDRLLVGESTVEEIVAGEPVDIIKVMNKKEDVTPDVTEVVVSEPKK